MATTEDATRLFWTDPLLHEIEAMSTENPKERHVIPGGVKNDSRVTSITTHEQSLFWSVLTPNATIISASLSNLTDTKQRKSWKVPVQDQRPITPDQFQVVHAVKPFSRTFQSPCDPKHSKCSHFCFLLSTGQPSCQCSEGFNLTPDGLGCRIPLPPEPSPSNQTSSHLTPLSLTGGLVSLAALFGLAFYVWRRNPNGSNFIRRYMSQRFRALFDPSQRELMNTSSTPSLEQAEQPKPVSFRQLQILDEETEKKMEEAEQD